MLSIYKCYCKLCIFNILWVKNGIDIIILYYLMYYDIE